MKVGVVSDSHGNVEAIEHLVQWFTLNKCKKIIHLGDDWDDAKKQIEIIKVPGVLVSITRTRKSQTVLYLSLRVGKFF